MKLFSEKSTLDTILNGLFKTYFERVPDVKKITNAMIKKGWVSSQEDIINDHVAFRTLGVKNLGIASFEKIFLAHGYQKKEFYSFEAKKLNAYWYAPPTENQPRIFISELRVEELSKEAQDIIYKYTENITTDPVDLLDLNTPKQVVEFFEKPLWKLPTLSDYNTLLNESEYAAWVLYNRYYLNHYTISVHELPNGYDRLEKFNEFLVALGIKLNDAGGVIKISKDGLLLQSSSVAEMITARFEGNDSQEIAGSYVEFAERKVLSEFSGLDPKLISSKHRRDGFETANADKIFESTFIKQTKKEA
ncbi:DUF1338 domain-containing protein [Flavobacteriaceae bacterium]|uniref:DUF1338 domain-containing protein n=1 Tax=Candidatus Arcticimaribacter forsetii TaxID=2820661 RepID=UPI002076F759|nr:DUF1338 domain-containing protein [Candidatus Arcticimaribacter forsetii]MDA8699431.1 DUF1338 domain-containing protein [Flavobacteriaceae bacterium]MDB2329425.1 DUF1338 domain-containing protein [Flavobacteriaceae bacterium]MDB4674741.1 DUF1338 domain-containing protein [Flavobacteriaceae bacterium]MDB4716827.1 DUF1338 domain-containing protein [Flavobacteriaceae bacterium]